MYPSENARQLSILLRTSRELDIVGDVTATTDNPSSSSPGLTSFRSRQSAPGRASQESASSRSLPPMLMTPFVVE